MNIHPILNNVLIKPLKAVTKTEGGIILPNAKKQPDEGRVMAKGADVDSNIKIGNKVLFKKWEFVEVTVEGETEKWLMVEDKTILAIL